MDTQLNETINQNSIKSLKLLSQRIIKRYYKTLGTSVINSQLSPPSLILIRAINSDLTVDANFQTLAPERKGKDNFN